MRTLFNYTVDKDLEEGLLIGCIFASIIGLGLTVAEIIFYFI